MRPDKEARKEAGRWRGKAVLVDVSAETWRCLIRPARIFET
jgi:hypothetical protein